MSRGRRRPWWRLALLGSSGYTRCGLTLTPLTLLDSPALHPYFICIALEFVETLPEDLALTLLSTKEIQKKRVSEEQPC
ncbi:unnamed protein product [Caretta caretta]